MMIEGKGLCMCEKSFQGQKVTPPVYQMAPTYDQETLAHLNWTTLCFPTILMQFTRPQLLQRATENQLLKPRNSKG